MVIAMLSTVAFAMATPTNVTMGLDSDVYATIPTINMDWDDSWDYNVQFYREVDGDMWPYFGISSGDYVWLDVDIDRYGLLNGSDRYVLEDGVYSYYDGGYGVAFLDESWSNEGPMVEIDYPITYYVTPHAESLQATWIADGRYEVSGLPANTSTLFGIFEVADDSAHFNYSNTCDTDNYGILDIEVWDDFFTGNDVTYLDVYTTTELEDGGAIVEVDLYEVELLPAGETPTVTETVPVTSVETLAAPTSSTVLVDGELQGFNAYNINNNNYFMLRDIAAVVNGSEKQFEVIWDNDLNAINLVSGSTYSYVGTELVAGDGISQSYIPTTSTVYVDGVEASFEAYTINGSNYFKLRDVCATFDIGVTWDEVTQTIGINTADSYVD